MIKEIVETGSFFVAPTRAKRPLGMKENTRELDDKRVRGLIVGQLYGLGQKLLGGGIFDCLFVVVVVVSKMKDLASNQFKKFLFVLDKIQAIFTKVVQLLSMKMHFMFTA